MRDRAKRRLPFAKSPAAASMDGRVIYLDVTSSCKSPMNTGVQRVVRGLYRVAVRRRRVTPLLWDPALAAYCTLSRREHGFLENPFAQNVANRQRRCRAGPPREPHAGLEQIRAHGRPPPNRLDLPARLTAADTLFVPGNFSG